jgi:hypothetical protein
VDERIAGQVLEAFARLIASADRELTQVSDGVNSEKGFFFSIPPNHVLQFVETVHEMDPSHQAQFGRALQKMATFHHQFPNAPVNVVVRKGHAESPVMDFLANQSRQPSLSLHARLDNICPQHIMHRFRMVHKGRHENGSIINVVSSSGRGAAEGNDEYIDLLLDGGEVREELEGRVAQVRVQRGGRTTTRLVRTYDEDNQSSCPPLVLIYLCHPEIERYRRTGARNERRDLAEDDPRRGKCPLLACHFAFPLSAKLLPPTATTTTTRVEQEEIESGQEEEQGEDARDDDDEVELLESDFDENEEDDQDDDVEQIVEKQLRKEEQIVTSAAESNTTGMFLPLDRVGVHQRVAVMALRESVIASAVQEGKEPMEPEMMMMGF